MSRTTTGLFARAITALMVTIGGSGAPVSADAVPKDKREVSLDRHIADRQPPPTGRLRRPAKGAPRFVTVDGPGFVRAVEQSVEQRIPIGFGVVAGVRAKASLKPHVLQDGPEMPAYQTATSQAWSGPLESGGSIVVVAHRGTGETVVEISLWAGSRAFKLERADDGQDVIVELDPSHSLPPDDGFQSATGPTATAAAFADGRQVPGPAGTIGPPHLPVVLNVAVLFTRAAEAYAGGSSAIRDRAAGLVAQANATNRNSLVPIHFHLAATAQTSTDEDVNAGTGGDLRQLRVAGDGRFEEAAGIRSASNADLVALVGVGYANSCGTAFHYQNNPPAHVASFGFSVVSLDPPGDFICDDLTIAHEFGHNLGGDHDWNNQIGNVAFSDGHGFQHPPGQWATVMAYTGPGTGCDPCTHVPHESNPSVTYGGVPTGVTGGDHPANNARVFTATAESIDAYRPMRTDRYGPGAVSSGSQRMDLVARGSDDVIHHRRWTAAGGWGGWSPIHTGATTKADPDVASWGQQRLDAVHLGQDGAVWWASFNGTAWSGWTSLGGILTSAPSIVSLGSGELQVFGRGIDGALWTRSMSGGVWQPWFTLGGIITSDPDAASWAAGRADVFARGTDGAVWHRARTASGWSSWDSLGHGILTSAPTAVSWGPDRIDIFARGTDGHLWHNAWADNHWYGWYLDLGGVLTSAPDALSRAPGTLDVYGRGTDGALWRKTWNGSAWQPWTSIG